MYGIWLLDLLLVYLLLWSCILLFNEDHLLIFSSSLTNNQSSWRLPDSFTELFFSSRKTIIIVIHLMLVCNFAFANFNL